MSLCRLFQPHFFILCFDSPRNSPKITCVCVYLTCKAMLTCIRIFWSKTHIHQQMCVKTKVFVVFLIKSRITWLLAFHMPWERSDSTLHFLFGVLYIEPLGYIEAGGNWKQGNYSPWLPHLLCLSLHPFVPLDHIVLLFLSFPCICKLVIVMEDWSGGGPCGGLGFSGSKKCRQRLSLLYLYFY